MNPNIKIPLLVVCVVTLLVAMGMFYSRDERKEKEATIDAKDSEKAEKNEDTKRTMASKSETRMTPQKNEVHNSGKVTIKGVSINLPLGQLKQELANKFGGISREGTDCILDGRGSYVAMKYLCDDDDKYQELLLKKRNYWSFEEHTAFNGFVQLLDNGIVRINFSGRQPLEQYEKELQKKYGHGEKLLDGRSGYAGSESIVRVLDDGIIIVLHSLQTDVGGNKHRRIYVYYIDESFRERFIRNMNKDKKRDEGGI